MRSDGPQPVVAPPPPPPPPAAPGAPGVAGTPGAPGAPATSQVDQNISAQVREQVREAIAQARVAGEAARAEAELARATSRNAGDLARLDGELARARREAASLQATGANGERTVIRSSDGATIVRNADGSLRITSRDGKTITIQPGMLPGPMRDAMADAQAAAQAPPPIPVQFGPPPGAIEAMVIMVAFLIAGIVLFPIARAWARRMDRRAVPSSASPELVSRLDRLEQAVEAVAIEMERVSEAQRYSAKLLTERLPERLPQMGAASAVTAPAPAIPDARG